MLSRAFRRLNTPGSSWASLSEFAVKDADAVAFRSARALSLDVNTAVSAATTSSAPPKVDWTKFESEIKHKDLVKMLKDYHDTQVAALDGLLKESSSSSSSSSSSFDGVYDEMLTTANKSVEQSESIVANGAKALYISSNNPSVGEVGTSEWVETDQYWGSFVEKHQYYHNHLDCTTEDPESKEYQTKLKTELMKNLKLMDDVHPRKGMLYQKPSYEYYNFYKQVLVEHMTYYLIKVGGDARTFPELPPHSWMQDVYNKKWEMLNILQRRRRIFQEETLKRELDCEYMPHDLVHGEGYYSKLIAKENALVEAQVGRLMASYSFLSDAIPVQTSGAFYSVSQEYSSDSGGQWYSLGDDVNAVFFKPSSADGCDSSSVEPSEAWVSYVDHLALSGQKLHPVLNVAGELFTSLLDERKKALNGNWFNITSGSGKESSADAFLRRVKIDDPCRPVYEEYVTELKDKWANCAITLTPEEASKKISSSIESQYYADLATYESSVLYSGDQNAETKAAVDMLSKAVESGELPGMLESGSIMAFGMNGEVLDSEGVKGVL